MDATRSDLISATIRRKARRPRRPIVIPPRVAERAATRYVVNADGCHVSTYSVASHGYAQIGWQGSDGRWLVTAHRAVWVYHTGRQIPDGMTIDHLCKERRCVNFAHLRMLSNFENARRTQGRDWPLGECANGHPNSLLIIRGGKLMCSVCVTPKRPATRPPKTVKPARKDAPEGAAPRIAPKVERVTPPARGEVEREPRPAPTHCNRGHELTPENVYIPPSRFERVCRTCQRIRESNRPRRKRVGSGDSWRWETASEVSRRRKGEAA